MNIFRAGLLASLALLFAACTQQLRTDNATARIEVDERVIQGQLANGLRYRLVSTDEQPGRLDIRLRVEAGSLDETDDQPGVAHLVEHLLFYNRDAQGVTARQRLLADGWQQGRHFNAMTSAERTLYMLSPPAGNQDAGLALSALAQLVLQQNFSAADLENERPIVLEEWRGNLGVAQRMNDQRRDSQRVGSRYAGRPPIGSQAAIEQAQVDALHAFHRRWYVPNGMQLNIVGDFDASAMIAEIEAQFAAAESRPLPPRDLELPVMPGLKAFRLQDSESGSHQVTLMFRGHHAANRKDSLDGQRERLLDRITTRLMLTQVQRQPLPEGVRAFTLQRAQYGQQSEVIAFSASLQQSVHREALQALLTEVQRMRRFGLSHVELEQELEKLRGIAARMLARGDERGFTDWVELLSNPSQADSRIQTRSAVARNSLVLLDGIRLEDVNARMRRWTDSPDRVLQLSAPTTAHLPLPDEQAYQALLAGIDVARLAPPVPPKAEPAPVRPGSLPAATRTGDISAVQRHQATGVQYWQLANGDRFVWLKRPDAEGKAYLQIDSASGYRRAGRSSWLEQTASQLVWNSPPAGFDEARWRAWQDQEKLRISHGQHATRTVFKADAAADRLDTLFALYRSKVTRPSLSQAAVDDTRQDFAQRLARELPTVRQSQERVLTQLRFGPHSPSLPKAAELERLDRDTLLSAWGEQAAAPVTYYLVADLDEATLAQWVRRELAAIPRRSVQPGEDLVQRPGVREQRLASAIEPRANVQVLSFSAREWTPEDAVRVASLKVIAADALKARLRGEARGLYQLSFDSELNPETGRLESRLAFSCDPRRLDELWQQAEAVLRDLPTQIDPARITRMRNEFAKQEQARQQDNPTQLHRLVLSDRQWGDPRYLERQAQLAEALQPDAMKALARELLSADNRVRLDVLPRAEARP